MKKLISAILLLTMVFALVACGGNKYNNTENNNPYNLDMKSTEKQKMSAERASKDVLRETAQTYLAGLNYFEGTEQANLTYNDLKEHIGVDASSYRYDESRMCELYGTPTVTIPQFCIYGSWTANSMPAALLTFNTVCFFRGLANCKPPFSHSTKGASLGTIRSGTHRCRT